MGSFLPSVLVSCSSGDGFCAGSRITFSLVCLRVCGSENSSEVTKSVLDVTVTDCIKNLSLQFVYEAGGSRWGCIIIWISFEDLASIMPLDGRTTYFVGAVVFTLNATGESVTLVRLCEELRGLFSSNLR